MLEGIFWKSGKKDWSKNLLAMVEKKFWKIFTLLKRYFCKLQIVKSITQIDFGKREEITHLWIMSKLITSLSCCIVEFLWFFVVFFSNKLDYHVLKLRKLSSRLCKKFIWQKYLAKFHYALNLFYFLGLSVCALCFAWDKLLIFC